MLIREKIKYERVRQGYTQKEFSKKLNLTYVGYGNYERGKRNPNFVIKERIFFLLDIDFKGNLFNAKMNDEYNNIDNEVSEAFHKLSKELNCSINDIINVALKKLVS